MYKIMIVEDDKSLCTNMNEMLLKWGFGTATVDNFENIAAEYAKNKPNLIIMDVNLSPTLMDFIGVIKLGKYQRYL